MSEFGYHTIGASTNDDGGTYILVSKETLSEQGDVSKLTVYVDGGTSGAEAIKGIIYADSSGVPGALMGVGTTQSVSAGAPAAWLDLPFSSSVSLGAGTYWIGIHFQGGPFRHYYDTATANTKYKSSAYATDPNPLGTVTGTTNQRMSIYATYTPTGVSPGGESSTQTNLVASLARRPHRGFARVSRSGR